MKLRTAVKTIALSGLLAVPAFAQDTIRPEGSNPPATNPSGGTDSSLPSTGTQSGSSMDRPMDTAAPMTGDVGGSGTAGTAAMGEVSDAQAAEKLHLTNEAEISMGKAASKHATNKDVKALGETVAKDHEKADKELKDYAKKNGLKLDAKMAKMDEDMMKEKEKDLKNLKGAEFDKAFLTNMVEGHKKTIAMIEGLKAGPLATWANTLVPTLQSHLDQATQLQSKVGSGVGGSGLDDTKVK